MKLLVFTPVLPPLQSGEADYAYCLLERLSERGIDVKVVTSRDGAVPLVVPAKTPVAARIGSWGWRGLAPCLDAVRRERPDAVLLLYLGWIFGNHPMGTYLPWAIKRLLPGTRVVTLFYNRMGAAYHQNDLWIRAGRFVASKIAGEADACYEFGTLLSRSDRVVVLAEKHGAFLVGADPRGKDRLEVVPPPPLIRLVTEDREKVRERERSRLGVSSGDPVIVNFGFVRPGKGHETLLDGFARFKRYAPGARLIVVGGSMEERAPAERQYGARLKELAANLGVTDSVHWVGDYDFGSEEPSRLLSAADIAALPYDDGVASNNSSLAAVVAHGLPVVTTRGPETEAWFRDGEQVIFCTPKDSHSLAEALRRVLSDAPLRDSLRRGATGLALGPFSWDNTIDKLLSSLHQPTNR